MGKHVDSVNTWVQQFDDQLALLHKTYGDPLLFESAGESAAPSKPGNAELASDSLAGLRNQLDDLRVDMLTVDLGREAYWKGPAASLFGETMSAYRSFMTEVAVAISTYATVTKEISTSHSAAQVKYGHALDGLRVGWKAAETKWYHLTIRLAQVLELKEKNDWWNPNRPRISDNVPELFDKAFAGYKSDAQTVYDRAKGDFQKIWDELSGKYGEALIKYVRLPSPEFAGVVAPDNGRDEKTDDLKTGEGPPYPDLTDLSKLLGGGGPGGGGLPDLPGGGLPDLGGGAGLTDLPGGGLPDLGGGAGLTDLPGGGLPGLGVTDLPAGGLPGLGGGGLPGLGGGLLDLPAGSRSVRRPDGSMGIDLNGDGVADVGADGRALPGGDAPNGGRLVTGPDGTTGYDITGNDVPDLGLDMQPLPGGDLPAGSTLVTGPDGTRGIDTNGDGRPDLSLDGKALPGSGAPVGGQVVTGPDGRTGFDVNGDGVPDVDFDGRPLSSSPEGLLDPGGRIPGDNVRRVTDGGASDGTGAAASQQVTGQGMGFPPPIPPAVGGAGAGAGGNGERERQTWLQEDESVWADDLTAVTALGRPVDDEDDDEPVDEWAAPVRRPRGAPRGQRPAQGAWQPGTARR
ncbi:hypothetical protein ACH4OY_11225 [Micromonospora rubida]|uniref:WXG100 family type VII secretion target n=1 Tax=Micromonospora rubida TaxID=2697657 RepID=A0ABW7SKM3_9ACTN